MTNNSSDIDLELFINNNRAQHDEFIRDDIDRVVRIKFVFR